MRAFIASQHRLPTIVISSLILSILSGCGTVTNQSLPTASVATPTVAMTSVPIPSTTVIYGVKVTPTSEPPPIPPTRPPGFPTPDDPIARATRIARHLSDLATQVALSPVPTIDSLPHIYPTPTPWLGLGPAPNGNHFDPNQPFYINGWRGLINGQYITVAAGRKGDNVDPEQGILVLFQGINFDNDAPDTVIYETPERLGAVHIISVNGMQLNLGIGRDDATDIRFTFDLSTRQWNSLTPLPSPSASP